MGTRGIYRAILRAIFSVFGDVPVVIAVKDKIRWRRGLVIANGDDFDFVTKRVSIFVWWNNDIANKYYQARY